VSEPVEKKVSHLNGPFRISWMDVLRILTLQ